MAAVTFPVLYFPRTGESVANELDHRIAQCRWNLTSATPEETLAGEGTGAACLTEAELRERYHLHLQSGEKHEITVGERNLSEHLLEFGVTKLCFKREGEEESLSQTYFQGLFEMEKEGLDWMKLSRKKFCELPSSLFIDCEGHMCFYHHHQGHIAKGTAKRIYSIISQDETERVRARFKSQAYRECFDKVKALAAKLRPCAQLVVPESYAYGDKFGQIMPRMKGDWFDFRLEMSQRDNMSILRDVALGLQWMHDMDVVHLDVKLDNVLITDDGKGRLADFDLHLKIKEGEKIPWRGSLEYADPNLVRQRAVGRVDALAADFFSYGVLLHIICTNRMLKRSAIDRDFGRSIGPHTLSPISNQGLQDLVLALVYRGGTEGWGEKLQYHPHMPESMEQIINKLDVALSTS